MTRHDDDYDLWMMRMEEMMEEKMVEAKPKKAKAWWYEPKPKKAKADHPADRAAGGAIGVSDEAPDVTEEEWKQQLKWEKEADEAWWNNELEREQEDLEQEELKQQKEQEEQGQQQEDKARTEEEQLKWELEVEQADDQWQKEKQQEEFQRLDGTLPQHPGQEVHAKVGSTNIMGLAAPPEEFQHPTFFQNRCQCGGWH
jgi:hypothetical protein